jgi:hypothetical protein
MTIMPNISLGSKTFFLPLSFLLATQIFDLR